MLTAEELDELRVVLTAQRRCLQRYTRELSKLHSENQRQSGTLKGLEQDLSGIEERAKLLAASDFDSWTVDDFRRRSGLIQAEVHSMGATNWNDFVRRARFELIRDGVTELDVYEAMLSPDDLETVKCDGYRDQFKWDKWDYVAVGTAGVLAALTDFLLVRIPRTLSTGLYAGQAGSPLTAWLHKYDSRTSGDWFGQWSRHLEERCTTPFDVQQILGEQIPGMTGRTHRLQSLGHDPVLGFVIGVVDILRCTITGFSYDKLTRDHTFLMANLAPAVPQAASCSLIEALLREIGHLISDVATPQGLPAPFLGLLQALNTGSFGRRSRSVGEIARWMYLEGYDLRHFLTVGLTPAVIEILLRAYLMLRHYSEVGEVKFALAASPKYRSMLLTAHAIAALGNAGKVWLYGGNPLAINEAEWLALIRYLIPSMKYWLFDEERLRIEYMEHMTNHEWSELLDENDRLLTACLANTPEVIKLTAKRAKEQSA